MVVVRAQEEGHLTLIQIGSIRKNFPGDTKVGGTSKMDLCLDLDIPPY